MGAQLTGSGAGSLAVKIGHWEGWLLDLLSFCGDTATSNVTSSAQIPTRLAQVQADYAAGSANEYATIDGLSTAAAGYQATVNSFATGTIGPTVTATLLDLVNKDTPMVNKTSVKEALTILCRELSAASASINSSSVSIGAQTNLFSSPVGNPTFVWSAKDAAGRAGQYHFPETITATITQDAQSGATANQEPYSVVGQNAAPSLLSLNAFNSAYYGSGASITGNLVDPSVSNTGGSTGNLTVNGTFTQFNGANANYADNIVILTGSAGSTILKGSGTAYYTGQGSVEMVSDGSTLLSIAQPFGTASSTTNGAGGSPYTFVPSAINNVQYGVFVAYKLSSSSPAAGWLQVDLIDSAGSIITDDQSVSNSAHADLTAIGDTNWHTLTAVFRMPQTLPTNTPYKLRIWQPTGHAVSSGTNVYIGAMGMAILQQFYAGGGYVTGFAGSTKVNASGLNADAWTWAVTNTQGKLQSAFWRFFNPPSLGPQTPGIIVNNSGSPTISDTLVA